MSDTQENFDFECPIMDTKSYEILLSKLKDSLCEADGCTSNYFNNVILECKTCIEQCLCAAVNSIDSLNCKYILSCLENAGCLLQMLSVFIRKVLASIPFVCSNMKQYPTATGYIILSVFNHCKSSENVYGEYLTKVQRQLKELFRTCHELQLTYLMTLEMHFTFDLSRTDDLGVLLEVLDLNLKISQVVENLDIKTMAEQWKSYTALCDKYCKYIEDKHIYRNSVDMLCEMIKSNMKNVLETCPDGAGKTVIRPVKVASFGIKILTKVCNIFKKGSHDYNEIIYLLIFLNTYNASYLELFLKKPLEISNLIEESTRAPSVALVNALAADQAFVHDICKVNEAECENEKFIGYFILLTDVMISPNGFEAPDDARLNVMTRMFRLLSDGHVWFNVGIELELAKRRFGLFEYALTVGTAFARTLSGDGYAALERLLATTLLETDCYGALFAADLWILLMRSSDRGDLAAETASSLLRLYRSLARRPAFHRSPQSVHVTRVIRNVFGLCARPDKERILNLYKLEDYFDLWSGSTPTEVVGGRQSASDSFVKMLKGFLDNDEIEYVLPPLDRRTDLISGTLSTLWRQSRTGGADGERRCERLRRLTTLTETFGRFLSDEAVREIHGTIGDLLRSGDENVPFVLFQKYCSFYERGVVAREALSRDVFAGVLDASDERIRRHAMVTLQRFRRVERVVREDPTLAGCLASADREPRRRSSQFELRMRSVRSHRFSHGCLSDDSPSEDAERPRSKRIKLDDGECESLISRLADDVRRLSELEAEGGLSDERKSILSNVLHKLQNILES